MAYGNDAQPMLEYAAWPLWRRKFDICYYKSVGKASETQSKTGQGFPLSNVREMRFP